MKGLVRCPVCGTEYVIPGRYIKNRSFPCARCAADGFRRNWPKKKAKE